MTKRMTTFSERIILSHSLFPINFSHNLLLAVAGVCEQRPSILPLIHFPGPIEKKKTDIRFKSNMSEIGISHILYIFFWVSVLHYFHPGGVCSE